MNIIKPVYAGSWYPDNKSECEKEIKKYILSPDYIKPSGKKYMGGIVPHAGWYYSGQIACNVINLLQEGDPPDAIVIFGMHLTTGSQRYIITCGQWETSFGSLPIHSNMAKILTDKFPFIVENPANCSIDNTIELQLPFIKYFFRDTAILPIGVPPDIESIEIGRAVADISKKHGINIRVIGSTDLTHYGSNFNFTPKGLGENAYKWVKYENDGKMIKAITAMDPKEVLDQAQKNSSACCSGAIAAAIATLKKLGAGKSEKIAYSNSYEKSPGNSFVGYTGIVIR